MPDTSVATEDRSVAISASAARRIQQLAAAEESENTMLRIAVSGGGCSGFQYGFSLDSTINEDDVIFEREGIKVVVDEMSLDFVQGSELDYVEDLIGSYFSLKNPNATSTCGCGSSFSV